MLDVVWNRSRGTFASVAFCMLAGCSAYDSVKDEVEGDSDSASISTAPEGAAAPPPTPTLDLPDATKPPLPTRTVAAPAPEPTRPPPPSHEAVPADFSGVNWLHHDVSRWAETATLSVHIGGGNITLDYSKAKVWPAVDGLNANPWIFVFRNGVWYAATFEWFRHGQTTKPVHVVAGDHIKRAPLGDFAPRSGEVYGFMVSGLARDDKRNVQERTPVVMARWP